MWFIFSLALSKYFLFASLSKRSFAFVMQPVWMQPKKVWAFVDFVDENNWLGKQMTVPCARSYKRFALTANAVFTRNNASSISVLFSLKMSRLCIVLSGAARLYSPTTLFDTWSVSLYVMCVMTTCIYCISPTDALHSHTQSGSLFFQYSVSP